MGSYTELNISVNLELDDNTRKVLEFMVGDREEMDFTIPSHPLFESNAGRWKGMLYCDSFYFSHTAGSSLVNRLSWREPDSTERVLNVRCDLKNYDDEINKFLDWIRPYSITRGFIGYTRFEEAEDPTLIYFNDEGFEFKELK